MAWKTLYVSGKPGCDKELLDFFVRYEIDFMTGSFNENGYFLFWVTEDFVLEKFKKKIGSKVIFKYRIRFFFSVDAFVTFRDKAARIHSFTADQEQMFRDLNEFQ